MNLVLFGFKNSGKTHFGKLLAKELGIAFLDTDDLLCDKRPLRDLWKEVGEVKFREMESQVINSLKLENTVIALGGGAIFHPNAQKLGILVHIVTPFETLKRRGLPDWIEKIYPQRMALYEKIPSKRLLTEGKTDEKVIEELKGIYGK